MISYVQEKCKVVALTDEVPHASIQIGRATYSRIYGSSSDKLEEPEGNEGPLPQTHQHCCHT